MTQVLAGPVLKMKTTDLLWVNAVKALLVEIWFERNQKVFHDKPSTWMERFDSARLNASSWCSLSKDFQDYSSQDIVLNWSHLEVLDHQDFRLNPQSWVIILILLCSQPASYDL